MSKLGGTKYVASRHTSLSNLSFRRGRADQRAKIRDLARFFLSLKKFNEDGWLKPIIGAGSSSSLVHQHSFLSGVVTTDYCPMRAADGDDGWRSGGCWGWNRVNSNPMRNMAIRCPRPQARTISSDRKLSVKLL